MLPLEGRHALTSLRSTSESLRLVAPCRQDPGPRMGKHGSVCPSSNPCSGDIPAAQELRHAGRVQVQMRASHVIRCSIEAGLRCMVTSWQQHYGQHESNRCTCSRSASSVRRTPSWPLFSSRQMRPLPVLNVGTTSIAGPLLQGPTTCEPAAETTCACCSVVKRSMSQHSETVEGALSIGEVQREGAVGFAASAIWAVRLVARVAGLAIEKLIACPLAHKALTNKEDPSQRERGLR